MLTKTTVRRPKIIRYIVFSVDSQLKLERYCPHCNRSGGNIHSGIRHRAISDIKVTAIAQRRMKCPFCGTSWTIRTKVIGPGRQRSDRLLAIGVILYMFGPSYHCVEKFLPLLDCRGSKSTFERDVAQAGPKTKSLHFDAPAMRVRILGVDGTGAKMAGRKAGLLFFVDMRLCCREVIIRDCWWQRTTVSHRLYQLMATFTIRGLYRMNRYKPQIAANILYQQHS